MFRRDAQAPVSHDTPQTPKPARRPAHESKIFTQGRTFAERKAEADANRAARETPRLASMGESEFIQRDQRTGRMDVIPAKLYMDVDHPMRRFVQLEGRPGLIPLHDLDGRRDEVTKVGPMQRHGRGPSALTQPASPDAPAYRI